MNDSAVLTLRDVAALAHVQRPVVSMWRRRTQVRGEYVPFPTAIAVQEGIEVFERDAVVDWLLRTGRGRNPEQQLDAAGFSVPAEASLEELITFLSVAVLADAELADLNEAELAEAASHIDPDDTFVLREMLKLRGGAQHTRQYIDELLAASFGPAEALDRLESGRAGRQEQVRDLTDEAHAIIRSVSLACEGTLDPEGVALFWLGHNSPSLPFRLAPDFASLAIPGDDLSSRALRRRAMIRSIDLETDPTGPSLSLLSVMGMDQVSGLDALDEMVLSLGNAQLGVAIGPARLLCDALPSSLDQRRSLTVRSGTLRLALRLPRGMWRDSPRQALGIWVCSAARGSAGAGVADLSDIAPHDLALDDLSTDVAAALTAEPNRQFRYARYLKGPRLLSSRNLVPRGTQAKVLGATGMRSRLTRIQELSLKTAVPTPSYDVFVSAAPGTILVNQRSLADLVAVGKLTLRRGSRLDLGHADPEGSVLVIHPDPDEEAAHFDPLDATRLYPRATRTEPGDVIFSAAPRPIARVDTAGGSLVPSPARFLRLAGDAALGPHTLAAIINLQPSSSREWQTWLVPVLDATTAEALEAELEELNQYHQELRHRITTADQLSRALIDGVAAGAVTITRNHEEGI